MGKGVSELRINHGPGYRVYYKTQIPTVIVLLNGGSKQTQKRDIEVALRLAQDL